MKPEYDKIISQMLNGIEFDSYRHLVFLFGSVGSIGVPSSIPGVKEITKELVLDNVLTVATRGEPSDKARLELTQRMKQWNGDDKLRIAVDGLAFEQFMSCLHQSNPGFALNLVKECAHAEKASPPINDNHKALAAIATRLREEKRVDQVTIITTNYDRCIEEAFRPGKFRQKIDPDWPKEFREWVPAYYSDDGSVRVIKPHGCIQQEKSLVFTMEGMFRMLYSGRTTLPQVADHLFEPGEKVLVLCLGYGFNDPDLHPLWDEMNSRCKCWFVVNERDGQGRRMPLPNPPSGRDVLRDELLGRFKNLTWIESNLFLKGPKPGEKNVLTEIASRVRCIGTFAVPVKPDNKSKEQLQLEASKHAAPGNWIDDFLLNIVNTAARGDARTLLKLEELAASAACDDTAARKLVNQLEQFANANEPEDGIEAADILRKEAANLQTRALSLVFESFLRVLIFPRGCWYNLPWVVWKLYLPWRKFEFRDDSFARAFFEYYRLIIPVMVVHTLHDRIRILRPILRCSLKRYFRAAVIQTLPQIRRLKGLNEVKLMGSVLDMRARLFILLNKAHKALKAAERASLFATAGGRMTDSALADRWWGHAHLLNGNKVEAMKHFRRGLRRAVACSDGSIADKIACDAFKLAKSCVPEEEWFAALDLAARIYAFEDGFTKAVADNPSICELFDNMRPKVKDATFADGSRSENRQFATKNES